MKGLLQTTTLLLICVFAPKSLGSVPISYQNCRVNLTECYLDCSFNYINGTLPAFSPLPQYLQVNCSYKIDLSHNLIEKIPAAMGGTTQNSIDISKLNFKYNRITSVDDDAFSVLNCRTRNLYFSFNTELGPVLTEQSFTGLECSLEHLELESCDIRDSTLQAFRRLRLLESLNLRNNKLTTIPADTFANLPKLRLLNLGRNVIHIPAHEQQVFKGLINLRDFDISHNRFTTVSQCTFGWLTKLQRFEFSGLTDLKCDCNLKWLRIEWIQDSAMQCVNMVEQCPALPPNNVINCTPPGGPATIDANLSIILSVVLSLGLTIILSAIATIVYKRRYATEKKMPPSQSQSNTEVVGNRTGGAVYLNPSQSSSAQKLPNHIQNPNYGRSLPSNQGQTNPAFSSQEDPIDHTYLELGTGTGYETLQNDRPNHESSSVYQSIEK